LTIEIEKKCHPRDHKFSQKMRNILPLHGNFSNLSNTSSQLVDKHCRMFNSNMTGLTCGAETADLSEVHTGFSGVRVNRSLVLCVCVVDCCLSFGPYSFGHCIVCPSSFGHCVVCPSMIYGFWLHLWYLLTLLVIEIDYNSSQPVGK
jgi:hypothetical protein